MFAVCAKPIRMNADFTQKLLRVLFHLGANLNGK
ncbi:hypothetical protein HCH_03736 [Hahella chejuensis KCTC 2396]|uniref:Uncharacterized protein n=1 Tax=Hahella chejuensis (strain KCTC 2396) TaxID=349521 RepID=Q2SFV4_HAHCH|nr:hypothetical protein HCH_03736 [Hahella chejuensis KCTC 2396]